MENQWYVYLLECLDGSFYTGITNNLDARMDVHAKGSGSKYVYRKGFKQLLFAKPCKDKSQASKFEYAIKQLPKKNKIKWFEDK